MAWDVEFSNQFGEWWETLTGEQQDDVDRSVRLLAELGPALGFPHSSKIVTLEYNGMRELRTQSAGKPLRTLYIFDPLRVAILLIGSDKTGRDRWYEQFVPIADAIFNEHLEQLRKEGKL